LRTCVVSMVKAPFLNSYGRVDLSANSIAHRDVQHTSLKGGSSMAEDTFVDKSEVLQVPHQSTLRKIPADMA